MSKYQYAEKCREVLRFWRRLRRCLPKNGSNRDGMALTNTKEANPTFDQFKNIYGLTTNENDARKDAIRK